MNQDAANMERRDMAMATEKAWFRVRDIIEVARKFTEDSGREDRQKVQKCKACFYQSRIAGQAFTTRACMCCGEPHTYTSTATDVLCLGCAKANRLCKACGGDIDMDTRRRDWPAAAPRCTSTTTITPPPELERVVKVKDLTKVDREVLGYATDQWLEPREMLPVRFKCRDYRCERLEAAGLLEHDVFQEGGSLVAKYRRKQTPGTLP
jgi:hypothetical protein